MFCRSRRKGTQALVVAVAAPSRMAALSDRGGHRGPPPRKAPRRVPPSLSSQLRHPYASWTTRAWASRANHRRRSSSASAAQLACAFHQQQPELQSQPERQPQPEQQRPELQSQPEQQRPELQSQPERQPQPEQRRPAQRRPEQQQPLSGPHSRLLRSAHRLSVAAECAARERCPSSRRPPISPC
jgi:hypothetical protein